MHFQNIQISGSDGEFGASLHLPATVPAPVVVLAHEIFGVNAFMEHTAQWLASAGFVVVCPDLFWRQGVGIALNPADEHDMKKALTLWKSFDMHKGVADLHASIDHVASQPFCNGKVSLIGYCLGGALAVLMAGRPSVHKSVGYYGVGLEEMAGPVAAVSRPLMMHMPGNDHLVSTAARQAITASMAKNDNIDLIWYEGQGHAFARRGGNNYSAVAAELANERTLRFLQD